MMGDKFYVAFSHDVMAAILVLPDNEKGGHAAVPNQ